MSTVRSGRGRAQWLKVEVVKGKLIISIGAEVLAFAAQQHFDGLAMQAAQSAAVTQAEERIVDAEAFTVDVRRALEREEEDGTTLVHRMFDKAFDYLNEHGAEGVDYPDFKWADAKQPHTEGGEKMDDALGDRMKLYECAEAQRRFMPLLPILARIDGRAFHAFTRGMDRPFDPAFSACMVDTTIALVKETNACMGYTQSDEITLAWHSTDIKSQVWFDGRIQKMVSQLAAQATLHFYRLVLVRLPAYADRLPTFDARVWQVPNRTEGANVFLWREWDATKNSLSMAADALYSHKELHGKNGADKHDLLMAKGVNWNDYPVLFKRGTYVQRRTVARPFTAEEIESLPPKHAARANPALTVERSEWGVVAMPPLASITNREAVIFEGQQPHTQRGSE